MVKYDFHIQSFSKNTWWGGPDGTEEFCRGYLEAKRTEPEGHPHRIIRSDGRVVCSLPGRKNEASETGQNALEKLRETATALERITRTLENLGAGFPAIQTDYAAKTVRMEIEDRKP